MCFVLKTTRLPSTLARSFRAAAFASVCGYPTRVYSLVAGQRITSIIYDTEDSRLRKEFKKLN